MPDRMTEGEGEGGVEGDKVSKKSVKTAEICAAHKLTTQ